MNLPSFKFTNGIIISFLLLFFTGGCSLLKVNLESESTPLQPDLLRMRQLTQDYLKLLFHDVILASDSIIHAESGKQEQIEALEWKINTTREAKNKTFQADPEVALMDTWIFTDAMTRFLDDGPGADLFGNSHYIAQTTFEQLSRKMDGVGYKTLGDNYPRARMFVDSMVIHEPIRSFDFFRESVNNSWYAYQGVPDSLVETNLGTLPQVMDNLSSNWMMGSEQTLSQILWTSELLLKRSDLDSLDLYEISDKINGALLQLGSSVQKGQMTLSNSALMLHYDLFTLMDFFETRMDSMANIAVREMSWMKDSIGLYRDQTMKDLDKTSNRLVETTMGQVHAMVKEVLFYLLLILIAILFIPFSLGYITGRTMGKRTKQH